MAKHGAHKPKDMPKGMPPKRMPKEPMKRRK